MSHSLVTALSRGRFKFSGPDGEPKRASRRFPCFRLEAGHLHEAWLGDKPRRKAAKAASLYVRARESPLLIADRLAASGFAQPVIEEVHALDFAFLRSNVGQAAEQ